MMKGKKLRRVEETEYNPTEDERLEWRRTVRKFFGKITGEVVVHLNDGEPLVIRSRVVIKKSE